MAQLRIVFVLLLGLALWAGCAGSKKATQTASTEAADEKSDDDKKKDGIKPYDEVVTEEMTHDEGLFDIHRDGQKVLYEIPTISSTKSSCW